jgi:prolyl oligopeptidase
LETTKNNAPDQKKHPDQFDRDTLRLVSPLGPNMATNAGFAAYGKTLAARDRSTGGPIIFQTNEDYLGTWECVWFVKKPDLIGTHYLIADSTGAGTKIDVPRDANVWVHGDWAADVLDHSGGNI